MNKVSVKNVLNYGSNFLKENAIVSHILDAQLLLCYLLDYDKIKLITNCNEEISWEIFETYKCLLQKRSNNMPLQYIIKKCEFFALDFYVDENVLIPRGDTEILVQCVLDNIKENRSAKILEIGTGSGCIAISLFKNLENVEITAVDISQCALAVAKKNAETVGANIKFIESDIFSKVAELPYDIIVSNPPYIETDEIEKLNVNVKDYEPRLALDGKSDGLYFYEKITAESKRYLNNNGMIFFEIGYNQKECVEKILLKNNFNHINIVKDLNGLDRVAYATIESEDNLCLSD